MSDGGNVTTVKDTGTHSTPRPVVGMTLSEVAELAQVSRAAVSNWRQRYEGFPMPVGTVGGREVFAHVDIEDWLQDTGRMPARRDAVAGLAHLGRAVAELRHDHDEQELFELAGAVVALRAIAGPNATTLSGAADRVIADLDGAYPLLDKIFADSLGHAAATRMWQAAVTLQPDECSVAIESMLAWRSGLASRLDDVQSPANFHNIAGYLAGRLEGHSKVYDPAVGEGGFLLECAKASPRCALFGQDVNEAVARLAVLRLAAHGYLADIRVGSSLARAEFGNLRADLVITEPPRGSNSGSSFDWLELALAHVVGDGSAVVFGPASSMTSTGAESRRRFELLRRGDVAAVVALSRPRGRSRHDDFAMWVLNRSAESRRHEVHLAVLPAHAADSDVRSTIDAVLLGAVEGGGAVVTVSILDLLDQDASITPQRWLAHSGSEEVHERFEAMRNRLDTVLRSIQQLGSLQLPRIDGASSMSSLTNIASLKSRGILRVIGGTRISPDEYRDEGTEVVTLAGLGNGSRRFVDVESLRQRPVLTKAGDIVVGVRQSGPKALLIKHDGLVVGPGLHVVRVTKPDLVHPALLAKLLSSRHAAAFLQGASASRLDLTGITLAALDDVTSAELERRLRQLEAIRDASRLAANLAEQLEQELITGVMAGAVRLNTGGSRP